MLGSQNLEIARFVRISAQKCGGKMEFTLRFLLTVRGLSDASENFDIMGETPWHPICADTKSWKFLIIIRGVTSI